MKSIWQSEFYLDARGYRETALHLLDKNRDSNDCIDRQNDSA